MSTEHTPGRMKIGAPPPNGEQTIGTESGLMIAVVTTGISHSAEANARRLVACWNACEGVPTADLEQGLETGLLPLIAEMSNLAKQNAELLKALKVMLRDYSAVHDIGDLEMQPAIYQARAAIAKAEGGAA